jgi:hypothetical protein
VLLTTVLIIASISLDKMTNINREMDTRFWGPAGWRLLHLSVTTPLNGRDFDKIKDFYRLLPFVLPCKFCRESLSKYYLKRPLPTDYEQMNRWLYDIHNEVNDKLRSQNLLKKPNPPFEQVQNEYMKWSESPCAPTTILGWDFLFSIANTTPSKSLHSSPIVDAPKELSTPELRNQWNMMDYKERQPIVEKWWSLLKQVFPYKPWLNAWLKGEQIYGKAPVKDGKRAVLSWLFKVQKAVCQSMMEQAPHSSFSGLCKEVSAFSSGCGKAKTKATKTCRAKKSKARETLRKERNRMKSQ